MKIFNCIFGILSIIGAIYCMFYPGLTFLNCGWIVTILLGMWGICSVIDYFVKRKKAAKAEQNEAVMGTLGLIVGIAAAVISVLAMFIPSIRLAFDIIILCIFSGWLVVDGISSVAMSFKVKNTGSSAWLIPLFCGILVIIGGIYGFFHLVFAAQTIGFMIGVLLAIYGIKLIVSVFEKENP